MSRTEENKLLWDTPISEKRLIQNFDVNEDFLIAFLKAKFHGAGHILPLLGFFPSLILLWTSVAFWRHVNAYSKRGGNVAGALDPVINLNPILQDIPQEHRAEEIEKLRKVLLAGADLIFGKSFQDIISESYKGEKKWFWKESKLLFRVTEEMVVNVDYLDPEESVKILESFAKSLENKTAKSVPSILIQETEHRIRKVFQQMGTNISLSNNDNCLSYKPSLNSALIHLWKSFFEKLLSPEEAYETLLIVGKQSPALLSMVIPNCTEDAIDLLAKSLRRLRSITEKRRSSFQEDNVFYAITERGHGPYTQEHIRITKEQFHQMEEMLSSVHSDFSIYQAMMLSLFLLHISSEESYQQTESLLEKMIEANLMTKSNMRTIHRYICSLLPSSKTIRLVSQGKAPLISVGNIISESNSRAFIDASFLLATIYDDAYGEPITHDILSYILGIRQKVLENLKEKKSWQIYVLELATQTESSLKLTSEKISFPLEEDASLYPNFLGGVKEQSYRSIRGRYVMALNRLLRFYGLLPIQFEDIIPFMEGTPAIVLYRRKGVLSMGFNSFKHMIEKAVSIFETLFHRSQKERLHLLSKFDELSPFVFPYSKDRITHPLL
jgi:hypothetical protein